MAIKGLRIVDMPSIGSAVGGNDIHFTLQFDDGEEATFLCDHARVGQVVVGLMRADAIARAERLKNDPDAEQRGISYPYDLEELNVAIGGTQLP